MEPYDKDRARPIEIRLRDMRDEGGLAESAAVRLGRMTCDAIFIARFFFNDDGTYAVETQSVVAEMPKADGGEEKPLVKFSAQALFDAWVRLAAYIAKEGAVQDPPTEEEVRQRKFLLGVLLKLELDAGLQRITPQDSSTPPQTAPESPSP